jgi:hypothetical protein
MKFIEFALIGAVCVGAVALLNWLGGEKHLLFNNARQTFKVLKKMWKPHRK